MRVGFIGLGNVGGKLAGSLLRNGLDLTVHELDPALAEPFLDKGADWAETPEALAAATDIVITCLPSPAACRTVVAGPGGLLGALDDTKVWIEMSTTDAGEMAELARTVRATGAAVAECPVSGGCHRAATGNISIFAGTDRATFERILPLLTVLGRRVLHTGEIGSASILKVMTNYLATANLVSLCEAMAVMKAQGIDLGTTYEAIRISSGTSFVHETESQLILNGSRQIDFTMDLVLKDIGLFQSLADDAGIDLDLSPKLIDIFKDGQARYGARAQSDDIVRRLEDASGLDLTAPGFPDALVDEEPEERGAEVTIARAT